MTVSIRSFEVADTDAVIALWQDAGLTRPWNDPRRDIERARAEQPELLLVAMRDDAVIGTVMAGYDGHRGWLYYLAVATGSRHDGIGKSLVVEAERRLRALGCPKVQLMVRPDNDRVRGFYHALGYEPFEVWATGKRLIADD